MQLKTTNAHQSTRIHRPKLVLWAELEKAQRIYGFVFDSQDVDDDPALAARFGDQVPVVTVNGKVRFRGGVNAVLLNRLLEAEAAKGLRKRPT